MEHETFWTLLHDRAHWEFELFVSVVFLFMETVIFWPLWNRWKKHHKEDDRRIEELEKRL